MTFRPAHRVRLAATALALAASTLAQASYLQTHLVASSDAYGAAVVLTLAEN